MARQLVGDAYIRIFGDSRFLRDAIHRDSKRVGKEGAESLLDSFSDTIRKQADQRLKSAQVELADAIAGGDFDRMLKRSGRSVNDFVAHMENDLRNFQRKGYFGKMRYDAETFQKSMDELQKWAKGARAEEMAEQEEMWRRAEAAQKEHFLKVQRQRESALLRQESEWRRAEDTQKAHFLKMQREREVDLAKQEDMWRRAVDMQNREFERITRDQARAWSTYGENLLAAEKANDRLTEAQHRNNIATRFGWSEWKRLNDERLRALDIGDEQELQIRRFQSTVNRTNILLNRHSDNVGRMFGAGSRSEFLNFIGRTIGNLSRIPSLVFAGFGKMAEFVGDIVDQFRDLRTLDVGRIRAAFILLGRSVGAALPSMLAFIAGIATMTQVLPAVISLVTMLAGSLVAVAGAISIGVIGGLLAMVPLLPSLAFGAGAAAIAMSALGDATDKQKKKLDPLVKSWNSLQKSLGTKFIDVISKQADGLGDVLSGLTPMLSYMVEQIGDLTAKFTSLFKSPAMQPFLKAWEESIPRIFGNLGVGLIRLGGALTAFFKPILPYAERLAEKFNEAMTTFLDWAKSAEGQNSIADFMRDAWDMGGKLWGIIKNIGSIIGSVFGAGAEGPGRDFLGWLEDVTGEWSEFLNTEAGQTRMKEFFQDVRDFMIEVKDIFGTVKERMEEVDWEQAADDALAFLDAVQSIVKAVGWIFSTIGGEVNEMRDSWAGFVATIEEKGIWSALTDPLVEELGIAGDTLSRWGDTVNGILDDIAGAFAEWAVDFWNRLTEGIGGGVGAIQEGMDTLRENILTALRLAWYAVDDFGINVNGTLNAVANMFIDWYNQSVGPVFAQFIEGIAGGMRAFGNFLITVSQVPGFEWVGGAGQAMLDAAGRTDDFADSIRDIPRRPSVEVLLEKAQAERNLDSLKRSLKSIPDEDVYVFVRTVETAMRGVPYGVKIGNTAAGGVFDEAQTRLIAEAGREAVVPLDRPLQMVDPTVRDLAAIAQGYAKPTATTSDGPNVHLEVHPGAFVLQNVSDPEVAAEMVVDRLAAAFRV